MKNYWVSLRVAAAIVVALLAYYYYFLFWVLPKEYTETINMDFSLLAGAEFLPAEKVHAGTFRVTVDFDKISGGIATYDLFYVSGEGDVVRIERWKERGNGIFDNAILDIPINKSMPHSSLYEPKELTRIENGFQVLFIREAEKLLFVGLLAVFMLYMLFAIERKELAVERERKERGAGKFQ